MKTVKVCHMTSAHPEEDVRIFHKECVSLAQAGYEVYLVERGESREKNGVHVVGVGEIPASRLKRMTEGARKVYEAAKTLDCDIYHFHDPELLPYGLKLKKMGKKVIYDSHELYRAQIAEKTYLPAPKLLSRLFGRYEDRVMDKLDGVIFPCTIGGKFPLKARRTALINNAPLLEEMYDKYDPAAEKKPNSVCMVGSLTAGRGIGDLVKAAHAAGCEAYFAGSFADSEYEREILAMPEAVSSHFLGKLNRDEVRELIQSSTVGSSVLNNVGQYYIIDNLPTKAYEYMSLGVPVLLGKTDYAIKTTTELRFGVTVDPKNTEEYAAAIRDLLENPDKAKQMGENGRKAVREYFNWKIEEKKLLQLYDSILAE